MCFCSSSSAYRCPLCMHSVCNMEKHWEQIGQEIAQTPMPPEYQDATVKVRPQEYATFGVLSQALTFGGSCAYIILFSLS